MMPITLQLYKQNDGIITSIDNAVDSYLQTWGTSLYAPGPDRIVDRIQKYLPRFSGIRVICRVNRNKYGPMATRINIRFDTEECFLAFMLKYA